MWGGRAAWCQNFIIDTQKRSSLVYAKEEKILKSERVTEFSLFKKRLQSSWFTILCVSAVWLTELCVCIIYVLFSDSSPLEAVTRHCTESPVRHVGPCCSPESCMAGPSKFSLLIRCQTNGSAFHWTGGRQLGQVNGTQVSDVSRAFGQNGLLRPWRGPWGLRGPG